ncbi:MAG: hypothetical protein Q9164_001585 [Protoblastenia rupestris]
MPSTDRDESRDRDLVLRHQPSFSDSGRSSVPMYAVSNVKRYCFTSIFNSMACALYPDRAPPPLPLNPGSSSPAAKPHASKNIAAAAEALTAKVRENTYTINPAPQRSPEKTLVKGHKRLESLQNGTLRNRNSYTDTLKSLDRTPSPEKSPERAPRAAGFENENGSPRKTSDRSNTPTPGGRDSRGDTSSFRQSRPPLKAILGENTPPSATMLALQNMTVPKELDTSLADITNGSTPNLKQSQTFDAISSQILSLTTIATSLQKEMAQLSRRSKDNATDLISLKEATNSRDEDIRKSLKDLALNLSSRLLEPQSEMGSRAVSSFGHRPGSLFLDSKPHNFEGGLPKSYSAPRMASPGLGSSELSASSYNLEGAASIALLEKILRDMGTKEGQERLSLIMTEMKDMPKLSKSDPQVTKKLEEILNYLKDSTGSRALVPRRDNGNGTVNQASKHELDFDPRPAQLSKASRELTTQHDALKSGISPKAAEFVNEDLQKLLKKMKDSITEGGGMTAEVKAHLRELRGEVLGMGRDIARKLDQAESTGNANRSDAQGPGREEIAQIVQDGLAELKDHMDALIREKRRQSSSSMTSRHSVDSQEVYVAVKNALTEFPLQQQVALQQPGSGIEREEILDAVREAWETYKPEIELQNFGLERDEILQCLKEGLQQYQPQDQSRGLGTAGYDEVLDAVREGLQGFKPPAPIETEASITKEEILLTVRECLETFDFPISHMGAPRELEITRCDILDAVKEGLSSQAPISKEIDFNRDDLFDAVKAGLQGARTPVDGVGEQVLDKMEQLIDGMRIEFKQYSVANGGDTEQVLDAMKDGLEILRADIETYVDRAADVTGKDEIIDTIRNGMDQLRHDLESSIANNTRSPSQTSSGELLDAMEKEFDHLRQTIATSVVRPDSQGPDREEILDILREGFEDMKTSMSQDISPDATKETINVMKEEFSHLRETLATTLIQGGTSADREEMLEAIREGHEALRADLSTRQGRPESVLSSTSELLDAFNDGLDTIRNDLERMMDKPLDMTVNYEILETLKEGLINVRADIDRLHSTQSNTSRFSTSRDGEVIIADPESQGFHRNDIGNLEMMITQLRIKVEALDNMPPPPTPHPDSAVAKEHIDSLETMLRDLQASVADIVQREQTQAMTKDDIDAFETLLRNTKAKVDEMGSQDSEGLAKVSHFETLESLLHETRDAVHDLEHDGASKKDIGVLEAVLQEVRAGLEEMREKGPGLDDGDRVSKSDIEALETLCMDTKTQIAELPLPDPDNLASKAETTILEDLVRRLGEQATEQHELTAQAFESRKVEHGGLADKIEEIKLIFDDVREELKAKIKDGHHSVKDLAQTVDTIAETIMATDTTATINELRDTVKREFEASHNASEGIKEHSEQNHSILLDKHEDHKNEIISDLNAKLDARFDEIMTKYDDAQLAAHEKEKALGSKGAQQEETLNATKTVAEDLRILVDALGSTVTESCDRMSEDSKTVFNRVEDVGSKLEELLAGDGKAEHQATRAEISKALASVEGVQAHASEYHPKILEAVKDVLGIVGQHYEQAKMSTEEIKTSVQAIPGAIPLPAIAPAPELIREAPVHEKYDDTAVHSKLDQLVAHTTEAHRAGAEMAMLEKIQEQVAATSADLRDLMAAQNEAVTETNDARAKELEEAAVAIEKRVAQKSIVEADIVRLSDQKAELGNDVQDLQKVKEELTSLKFKMQADLSSLETALQIRREELQVMEARADGLERRILDGVLDHSRSLLTTSRPQSSLKAMNLKRVTSTSSNATTTRRPSTLETTIPSTAPSVVSSGVGMALKRRQPPRASAISSTAGKPDRRILSLSTLGANKGNPVDRSMVLANPSIAGGTTKASGIGAGGMKRSHSVKSNFPVRKTSWGGTKALGMYADDGMDETEDKENSVLDEEDEEDIEGSEAGTERRTSYSGTYSGTGSYGDGSTVSSDDKRTSYAASTVGTIGTRDFAITEDGHDDDEEEEEEISEINPGSYLDKGLYEDGAVLPKPAGGGEGEMVLFSQDSGIGTDIPTAQLEGGSDYFKG